MPTEKASSASEASPSETSVITKPTLTEGAIGRILYRMALPMAGGILATMSLNIIDTLFVAQLGGDALAALSFTFPVVFLAISLSIGLGAGTSTVVAFAAGRNDDLAVKELATDSMTITALLSLLLTIVGLLTIEPLFMALGATREIIPLIKEYMIPWYISVVFLSIPMVGLSAIRALGNTKLQAIIMLGMAVLNIILDPFLIFGWWVFPEMGIEGAAVASLIVRVLSMLVLFYHLHFKMRLLVNPFCLSRLMVSWKKIMHVGVPAMATNMIIPVSGAVIVALVAQHGSEAVAGFGAASRIESIALIFYYALSAVVGPFCGQNQGAGEIQRMRDAQKITAIFCLISGVLIAVFLALFGRWLSTLFSDDPKVIDAAYAYLFIVPISYCAYGIVMVANACFNGIGKPSPGMVISSARVIFVLLPLAWAGHYFFGLWGIFAAITIANIIVGAWAYRWINAAIDRLH